MSSETDRVRFAREKKCKREALCQVSRRECGRAAAPKKLAEEIQVLSGITAAPVASLWDMEKK